MSDAPWRAPDPCWCDHVVVDRCVARLLGDPAAPAPGRSLTSAERRAVLVAAGQAGATMAAIGEWFGVSWRTARAMLDRAQAGRPEPVGGPKVRERSVA